VFDLLVDIYQLTESVVNGEPKDEEGANPLYAAVPACFVRLSGATRYTAAGVGVGLTHRLAVETRALVTERCRIRNLRTREGATVPAQPDHYDVKYVSWGRRGFHQEVDLEAVLS